jgi:hypothetical protein
MQRVTITKAMCVQLVKPVALLFQIYVGWDIKTLKKTAFKLSFGC